MDQRSSGHIDSGNGLVSSGQVTPQNEIPQATQDIDIIITLTVLVIRPGYCRRTWSISWLPLSWILASSWFWLCKLVCTCIPREMISTVCVISVFRNDRKYKYIIMFSPKTFSTTGVNYNHIFEQNYTVTSNAIVIKMPWYLPVNFTISGFSGCDIMN